MYRMGKEEIDAVARVINAGALFKVNDTEQDAMHLECEMQEFFGTDHAIIMTSGHAALTSALIAMGVGPGDEVIVPAYTYIATAMAVVAAGAMPVIVEVDETLTLSPEAFEAAITKNTKAVIPVHIQGFPCNMKKICEIAKKNGGEDIRSRITVNIESTHKEIDALNLELYEITNHEVPSDELNSPREIDLDLVGIHFLISESFPK